MSLEHESQPALSIVIPAFNDEATSARVHKVIEVVPHLFEVIVVDDCSTDRTADVARELAERYSQVRVARHALVYSAFQLILWPALIVSGDRKTRPS